MVLRPTGASVGVAVTGGSVVARWAKLGAADGYSVTGGSVVARWVAMGAAEGYAVTGASVVARSVNVCWSWMIISGVRDER